MTTWLIGAAAAFAVWFAIYWRECLVALAGIGFILIKLLNHRSRRTDFRISVWDLYQVLEYVFVFMLLLKGLDWI